MCTDCERSIPNQIVFKKIEAIITLMQDERLGLTVKTAKSFMSKVPSVFTGSDLIQWMMRNLRLEDQQEANHLANLIASHGYIFPIEDHTLSIKNDATFYRFQTPALWPSNNQEPENTDYAVYLCKRSIQSKTRLELADYEAENLARLQKTLARKWDSICIRAESQAKVDKKRDKLERKVLHSQERAFWDLYRPVPGCVNTTELDIKKACRMSKSSKSCSECVKVGEEQRPATCEPRMEKSIRRNECAAEGEVGADERECEPDRERSTSSEETELLPSECATGLAPDSMPIETEVKSHLHQHLDGGDTSERTGLGPAVVVGDSLLLSMPTDSICATSLAAGAPTKLKEQICARRKNSSNLADQSLRTLTASSFVSAHSSSSGGNNNTNTPRRKSEFQLRESLESESCSQSSYLTATSTDCNFSCERSQSACSSRKSSAQIPRSPLKGTKSVCLRNNKHHSISQLETGSDIEKLERQLSALKSKFDRRCLSGAELSKLLQSYFSYFKQWAEYDPFVMQPIPSNPWIVDSTELWDSERQTKDVHCRRVRRWTFSLKELLGDPAGHEQFHRFLEKEFSAENLRFWDAVQELKKVHSRDVARQVDAIWAEYLARDSNCPINIDSRSYETSKQNMAKNRNNRYIFDDAAGHVYQLMKNDSYPRYLRSEMYKDYRDSREKKRNQAFDVFKPQITTLKHKFNF